MNKVVKKTGRDWGFLGLLFTAKYLTLEEDVAQQAYRNILKHTISIPDKEVEAVRGRVARNLIKMVCEEEGNYKQALAMWEEFHKRLPREVTKKHQPIEVEA